MPFKVRLFGGIASLTLAALIAGCSSGDGPQLAKAQGVVLVDGKPVKDVGVQFHPVQGGPLASGMTDENGRFILATNAPGDGAVVGENTVTLNWLDRNATTMRPAAAGPIPRMYGSVDTTPFEAKVEPDQQNEYTFDVKSE